MKKLFFTFLCIGMMFSLFAQVPQSFNYQGVARDLQGSPLPNTDISLRIGILESSANGTEIYQETHEITTSSIGLFAVQIGKGSNADGDFEEIAWEAATHFVKIELDDNSGTGFQILGTSQLLSVPYALAAGNGSKWENNNEGINYSDGSVSIGVASPNPSAILDLSVSEKGLLLPNVALIESTNFQPLQAHVEGMMVYNTATINDVKPGVYINDGEKWIGTTEALEQISDLEESVESLENQIPIKRAVFIAGQSNTTWGAGSTNIPDFSNKNLSQLGRAEVNLNVVPLTFYGAYHNSRNVAGGGFGSIFMNHYYDKLKEEFPNREIQLLMVPCGAGGSAWSIQQYPNNSWRTDAAYFADIVSRIKWAKNNGYDIDAILWHQGESDAVGLTTNYKDILKNFIQSLRDYVGQEDLPFILGEMVNSWVDADPLRAPYQQIINDIPNEVPFTRTVKTAGLSLGDPIHFDAKAHVTMGQLYFDEFLLAKENDSPSAYDTPPVGEALVYNFNSTSGLTFPDIFSAIRYGMDPTEDLYSSLGEIWKYKNNDGYYRFKLEVVEATGIAGGVFEWKQKHNPFGLSENFIEDKAGSIILQNTIGIDTESLQGFNSLVYDSPLAGPAFTTLFHADNRGGAWWFAIGQVANFGNLIPIVDTNNTITHVRMYCIKE